MAGRREEADITGNLRMNLFLQEKRKTIWRVPGFLANGRRVGAWTSEEASVPLGRERMVSCVRGYR